jgi:hypothetical protein
MPEQRKPETRSFAPPSAEVSDVVRTYGITRSGETAHFQNWKEWGKIGRSRAYIEDPPLT